MDSTTGVATLDTLSGLLASEGEGPLRSHFGGDPILILATCEDDQLRVQVDTPSAELDTSHFSESDLKSTQEMVASPMAAIAKGTNLAVRVTKSQRNPFEGWITLGRAGNNDLVLSAPSVSKLHLIITPQPDGSWTVHDNGATNGSQLNDLPLPPHEARPLQFGDNLRIGGISSMFVDYETLVVICSAIG